MGQIPRSLKSGGAQRRANCVLTGAREVREPMIIHARYDPPPMERTYPPSDVVARCLTYGQTARRRSASRAKLAAEDAMQYMANYRQPINGFDRPLFYARLLEFYTCLEEIFGMTRKATHLPSNNRADLTFINCRLTDEEIADCDSLKVTPSQLLQMVVTALLDGYRFSFSYNPEKKTANAMFTDTRQGRASFAYALSAFSDDCADTLKLLAYKHYNKLAADWTGVLDVPNTRSTRG